MADSFTRLSLLARLRDPSDQQAWTVFHTIYAPLIESWLSRFGARPQDRDDIKQEVLQLAVTKLPEFEHSGHTGALRAWLRKAVANQLRTLRRRENKKAAAGGDDAYQAAQQLADPDSPLSRIFDQEYQRHVCEQLLTHAEASFDAKTMEAFRLTYLDEQPASEVAERLAVSVNSVRISRSRVLARLRELGQNLIE